jgi:hypothetical protein
MRRRLPPLAAIAVVAIVAIVAIFAVVGQREPAHDRAQASRPVVEASKSPRRVPGDRPRPRSLLGEVTDPRGSAVVGADVVVMHQDQPAAPVSVGADGQFSVELPSTFTALRFSAPGYLEHRVEAQALPTMPEAFWSQVLQPDPSARVVTVTAAGAPVAGATAFVVAESDGKQRLVGGTLSDEAGRLLLGHGDDVVVAHLAHGAVAVPPTAKTVALPASVEVRVLVVGEDKGPVAGANVVVRPSVDGNGPEAQALRRLWRRTDAAVTDEAGVVVWPSIAGEVFVDVAASGSRPERGVEAKVSGAHTDIVIKLQGREPAVILNK